MALYQVVDLKIGELGTAAVDDLSAAVRELRADFTTDIASELTIVVADHDLRMHKAGYFMIGRHLQLGLTTWEVAAVAIEHVEGTHQVTLECRPKGIQNLKRQKGAANFGKMSPTAFAQQRAREVGLNFIGQGSAEAVAITRQQSEDIDESTWDVLTRLANEEQFLLFESNNVLYFCSEQYIADNLPGYTIQYPSFDTDAFVVLEVLEARRSEDSDVAAEVRLLLDRDNAVHLRPGTWFEFFGLDFFDGNYVISSVTFDVASPEPVEVAGRMLASTEDMTCALRTFKLGDKGVCIKRIQLGVGVPSSGVFDAATEVAVKRLQGANGIFPSGIVEAETWKAIQNSGLSA